MTIDHDSIPGDRRETVEELAARSGYTVAELQALLAKPGGVLALDHVAAYAASRKSKRTRETYDCHHGRMLRGVGPVCDQTCEPCLVPVRTPKAGTKSQTVDFPCRCDCSNCRVSRITITPLGDLRVSPEVYSKDLVVTLSLVAGRYAVKSGIVANRRRAKRGMPPKKADGHNASETAISAMRSLFLDAGVDSYQDALKVKKPARSPKGRRRLEDFEFVELILLTETGGNDPDLDALILEVAIATGARCMSRTARCFTTGVAATTGRSRNAGSTTSSGAGRSICRGRVPNSWCSTTSATRSVRC